MSGELDFTELTHTRLEDNLIRHRGDRLYGRLMISDNLPDKSVKQKTEYRGCFTTVDGHWSVSDADIIRWSLCGDVSSIPSTGAKQPPRVCCLLSTAVCTCEQSFKIDTSAGVGISDQANGTSSLLPV